MAEKMSAMTLEQVRDFLHRKQCMWVAFECWATSINEKEVSAFCNAIDAHLTDHAQMMEKVREVADWLAQHACVEIPGMAEQADKLAIAIGDKNG